MITHPQWAQLEPQEQADYVQGLFFAFHPSRERTVENTMIDIGLADGQAARLTGMQIDKREVVVRDAAFIWRTCRAHGIGASPALLARLRKVGDDYSA